ncbi:MULTISPECIES: 6-phosphogluconolactonase [Nocardioides]|uniref:6-phosphogluconolactonase n=2 Tax=Nocardioidaceae TaxID=85015 RepID=UPI001879FAB7|nr:MULTISPECIES: 6-phosphogluconolactonase [Nocardioides]MCM3515384.1 6-phosphogluconolactonase [Nocardioides sp. P86]
MSTEPRVEVHDDPRVLATAVAGELLGRLADAQRAGRVPQVVLTGGTIAGHVHEAVAQLAPASEVDWSRVVLWWGDERFVAPDSEERNAGAARRAFVDAVGVPEEQVHEMPSTADADDVEAAAEAYAATFAAHGADELEVVMLGMGPDGHVASLFPGQAALAVEDRDVVAVPDSPKPPPQRVSLTFPALRRARAVWFLVSGEAKAGAVAQALGDAAVEQIPAVGVSGREETTWFLDREAASAV